MWRNRNVVLGFAGIIFYFSFILALGAGCSEKPVVPGVVMLSTATVEKIDLSQVKTKGNYSYIPLNYWSNPADCVDQILVVMNAFETAIPGFRVLDWHIERRQTYFYGIWVHHEPKK